MAGHSGDHARDEEAEEAVVVGGDEYPYYPDSDSDDDDDVDRYVFLARRPEAVDSDQEGKDEMQDHGAEESGGGQSEEDESSDDDDDAMPGGKAGGGDRGIRMIMDAPLPRKKARLVVLRSSSPPPPQPPSGVRHKKIGSEELAAAQAKSKKRRRFVDGGEQEQRLAVRRKRSSGLDSEGSKGSQPALLAAAEPEPEGASKRFVCTICGRSFGSYQALGGHVLGHKKKARSAAIAVAARDTVMTTVAVAPVNQRQNFLPDINGQGQAAHDGDVSDEEEKPVVADDVAACHENAVAEICGHGKAETASAIDADSDY